MLVESFTDRTLRITPDGDSNSDSPAGWRTAEVAHDLKNLLFGIRTQCEVARRELPDDSPLRPRIDWIGAASMEASRVCRELIDETVHDDDDLTAESIDLSALIVEMLPKLDACVSRYGVLDCDLHSALPLFAGDRRRVRQIVLNLVTNAAEALDTGSGCVRITTGVWQDSPFTVFLEVADTGRGMDQETVERMFKPLFTTKPEGSGVGLLSVIEAVGACSGTIEVSSAPAAGTTVRVLFPCRRDA